MERIAISTCTSLTAEDLKDHMETLRRLPYLVADWLTPILFPVNVRRRAARNQLF
jgi:hypothetical protein